MPESLRKRVPTAWAEANRGGAVCEAFLEGPSFDREGNLYLVDIPHGRVFKVTPALRWSVVTEYGGWPNGSAFHRDGSLWIADYRLGLLRLDPITEQQETLLGHRNSESFKGLNDLTFDAAGNCYFTYQGQSGMHDPSGRVFRLRPNGQLDCLLSNVPSPNGLVVDAQARVLTIAVTRANAIWRGPMQRDGSVSKIGVFQTFFGVSGPDGLAQDTEGRLYVAHASLRGVIVLAADGHIEHFIALPEGGTATNIAFRPGKPSLVITESETGTVFEADTPAPGLPLFSHAWREPGGSPVFR